MFTHGAFHSLTTVHLFFHLVLSSLFWFFSSLFYNFYHTDPVCTCLKYTPKYLIFLEPLWYFVFNFGFGMLVVSIWTCDWFLYVDVLCNLAELISRSFCRFLEIVISYADREVFFFPFPIWIYFLFLALLQCLEFLTLC